MTFHFPVSWVKIIITCASLLGCGLVGILLSFVSLALLWHTQTKARKFLQVTSHVKKMHQPRSRTCSLLWESRSAKNGMKGTTGLPVLSGTQCPPPQGRWVQTCKPSFSVLWMEILKCPFTLPVWIILKEQNGKPIWKWAKNTGNVSRQNVIPQKSELQHAELKIQHKFNSLPFLFLKNGNFLIPSPTNSAEDQCHFPSTHRIYYFTANFVITKLWKHNLIVVLKYEEMNQTCLDFQQLFQLLPSMSFTRCVGFNISFFLSLISVL